MKHRNALITFMALCLLVVFGVIAWKHFQKPKVQGPNLSDPCWKTFPFR